MDKKYICYMHISPSNKKYIGITSITANQRWRKGKGYKNNQYFTRAIKKYGWDNFQHIIVARDLTEDEAKWIEIELIKVWNSTDINHGYNITSGGESNNGKHHSEETKRLISEKHQGKFCGEKNPMYGKDWREGKTKEEIEEHNRKISKALKGRTYSEETRKKLSESHKGKWKGKDNPVAKKVVCITTGKIFDTMTEAEQFYNIGRSGISACCKGRTKSSGKLPDGTKLQWKIYTEGDDIDEIC